MSFDEGGWPYQGLGTVHDLQKEQEARKVRAVLWIPDPEQPHGWRERYVIAPSKGAHRRTLGFSGAAPRRRKR